MRPQGLERGGCVPRARQSPRPLPTGPGTRDPDPGRPAALPVCGSLPGGGLPLGGARRLDRLLRQPPGGGPRSGRAGGPHQATQDRARPDPLAHGTAFATGGCATDTREVHRLRHSTPERSRRAARKLRYRVGRDHPETRPPAGSSDRLVDGRQGDCPRSSDGLPPVERGPGHTHPGGHRRGRVRTACRLYAAHQLQPSAPLRTAPQRRGPASPCAPTRPATRPWPEGPVGPPALAESA